LQVPGFGSSSIKKEVAFTTLIEYRKGEKVTVFYNPDDPSNSRLKPGPTWAEFTRLSLWTILYGTGVFGLSIRKNKSNRSQIPNKSQINPK